ncbi:nucleoside-diphosphate-sugar epimerase [Rivularia sp. PCC 7116]|uniref:NAD-dependent epimerase/dehydratase family protein n=1 Tax=Rivularia sp. PCC 7116 TaxID=373994 RepID=UPI00029F2F92|nr:NAD(P)-dependent oxidoreductase [Rivularia sp. PCC 7116]AFY55943.1 nucleoside-diphosphate-sugar epimerase [Rivularia sp. PCC 7116]
MKLLVTGASGFLGQYVVAQALRNGHQISAVVRPQTNEKRLVWHNHPNVEFIRLDLLNKNGISDALGLVDAVIHLAAVKEGDFNTRFAGTVTATQNLLDAMQAANIMRLVNISTFSVYDYFRSPLGTTLTEESLIESNPLERDEYAQTKLIQSELVRKFERTHNARVTIIRPGLIYGRDNLWNSLLGGKLTKNLWLRIGGYATMPLVYVENCAIAIVQAAERNQAIGQIINIVDDNLPTQRAYVKKLKKYKYPLPKMVPVNWTLMRAIAWTIWKCNKVIFKGKAKLPGIANPVILDARFKHFRFSNVRAKEILNWKPKYSLDTALQRSCSNEELLQIEECKELEIKS